MRLTYHLKVVTPMAGGGAVTRTPSAEIRAASIRGQLRWWWRATQVGSVKSTTDLFRDEANLFGSASRAGRVQVRVEVTHDHGVDEVSPSVLTKLRDTPWRNELTYALWPFRRSRDGKTPEAQLVDVPPDRPGPQLRFTLSLGCPTGTPEELEQLDQAVRAWVCYGGIGARTRRGCGSLALTDGRVFDPPMRRSSVADDDDLSLVTALPGAVLRGPKMTSAKEAWKKAVDDYRFFRQGEGFARNHGARTPGRSRWPEPDSIRRVTPGSPGGAPPAFAPRHKPSHSVDWGFPRADLGLPIIFQFVKEDREAGDPPETTLGNASGRFASPVVTKAVQVAGGQFRPMIALLGSPHVWAGGDLVLTNQRLPASGVTVIRSDVDLSGYPPAVLSRYEPLRDPALIGGSLPAREALVACLQKRGWRRWP